MSVRNNSRSWSFEAPSGLLKGRRTNTGAVALLAFLATPAQAANLVGDAVTLRTLDKVTAQTRDFTVDVGETLEFGSLTIDVKHCEVRPPEEIPETFVFLQIDDRRTDGRGREEDGERVYSGWMLGSDPAKAALDHPVYDVWVIGCAVPERS